jgi:thiamine-monophosphate kinase
MAAGDDGDAAGEDRLIARYFKPLATHPGALALVDDTAVYTPPPGHDLVLKADAIVSGIHFFADDPPDTIARKALRVNLSDLAAKGAAPGGFLLSLALPARIGERWLEPFARALGEDAERFGCPLLGGDTVRSPDAVMVSIAVFGTVPAGTMVRRGGAHADETIFVTGTVGDAALGLGLRADPEADARWQLAPALREHLVGRYLVPQPRNALAEVIRTHASASIDVSDGLVGDLGKLCRASGLSALVEAARVPLSEAAQAALAVEPALIEPILTGGDDFEVICTVADGTLAAFTAAAQAAGVAVSVIGRMITGQEAPQIISADGRRMAFARKSFSHF